jgi:hypothetical protein
MVEEKSEFETIKTLKRDINIYRVLAVILLLLFGLSLIELVNAANYQSSLDNSIIMKTQTSNSNVPSITSSSSLNSAINYINTTSFSSLNNLLSQNESSASKF